MIKQPENYLDLSGLISMNSEANPFYKVNPGKVFSLIIERVCPNIKHLFLGNMLGINEYSLPNLNLESLGLSNNKLDQKIIDRAAAIYPNLKALYLDKTNIRLEQVTGFLNLEVLEIDDFKPSDADFALLLMPNIITINNYIIEIDEYECFKLLEIIFEYKILLYIKR